MVSKKIIGLVVLLVIAIATATASATSTASMSASVGAKTFTGAYAVNKGDFIQVNVQVQNTGTSIINGFWISVKFLKPTGEFTDEEYFDYTNVTLQAGQTYSASIKTSTQADAAGNWVALVYLRSNDASRSVIASDDATFVVSEPYTDWIVYGILAVGAVALGYIIVRRK
ncbi:hypothetical protein DRP07_00040 [Archaeoglobales archaeon]|nr:MAG: hypothetical protein DRP07_00040 [Archaeoglobales archaeon]